VAIARCKRIVAVRLKIKKNMNDEEKLIQLFQTFQTDPFFWIEQAMGLVPQPPKVFKLPILQELLTCPLQRFEEIAGKLTLEDFEPFERGKHLTWQQTIILIAYARALNGTLPRRIAVMTGKGLGKTSTVSWIICHFLYSFPRSLIMATAPTSDQLFSALWKEANLTIADMKSPFKEMFEWQTTFIRHKEDPYGWFARAKTADTVEALRGLHADSMLAIVDEASGVADEIINTGWSTMTNQNKVMILISNTSGNESLIERVFEEEDDSYTKLSFSAEQSPIVDQAEIVRRKKKLEEKGIKPKDDRDYRIDILGLPPRDTSEFTGWYRFFPDSMIDAALREVGPLDNPDYRQRPALGVDPAGEGSDSAPGVLRSFKWAKTIFEQSKSSSDSIAGAIATVLDNVLHLSPSRVFIDSFGVGHDVGQKVLANSSGTKRRVVRAVLVGESPPDSYKGRYVNVRAMLYDAMRVWFEKGGRIETDVADVWRKELRSIYAKKTASGKLQIMGKAEMRAKKMRSPGNCDALSLSFFMDAPMVLDGIYRPVQTQRNDGYGYTPPKQDTSFNKHDLIPGGF
jgi:phage terminase large subunit